MTNEFLELMDQVLRDGLAAIDALDEDDLENI
jgi:hypothetical protein